MADSPEIALSELIGALSSALDVAEGEPPGHAARSCLIGMRLADQLGLDADARSDLFYALLLKDAGCSANAAHMAALFGADDQVAKRTSKLVDWSRPMSAFVWSLKTVAPGGSLAARANRLRAIRDEGQVTKALMRARCHRGAEIVLKLGFSATTAEAIRGLDEHWDGHGQPYGLSGDEIPQAARILCLAQTVEVFHAARGASAACRVAVQRRGEWFDPALVDALLAFHRDQEFWDSLSEPDVSAVEPPDRVMTADESRLDRVADGFASVIDAKSPWTHEHCTRVCAIAIGMAEVLGFDAPAVRELGRAALLHDIGKLSISNRILDKPGPLTEEERTRFQSHPLLAEQILARVPSFGELAAVVSAHHERLDGTGYPRGLDADQLTTSMRVLAVADVYEALISDRPYRAAYSPEAALELMSADVPAGLDPDAFAALKALLAQPDAWPTHGPLTGVRPPLRRVR
ncbi:MAG TPA: HD domain-containing phosphohydrolase [Solirubrobacteraceae bacterium]|nr:HD domain-containing phosphohydrolase [Solirubrobacteraceae bacterium]